MGIGVVPLFVIAAMWDVGFAATSWRIGVGIRRGENRLEKRRRRKGGRKRQSGSLRSARISIATVLHYGQHVSNLQIVKTSHLVRVEPNITGLRQSCCYRGRPVEGARRQAPLRRLTANEKTDT